MAKLRINFGLLSTLLHAIQWTFYINMFNYPRFQQDHWRADGNRSFANKNCSVPILISKVVGFSIKSG